MAPASRGTVDGCQWLLSYQRYIATLKNLKLTLECHLESGPGPWASESTVTARADSHGAQPGAHALTDFPVTAARPPASLPAGRAGNPQPRGAGRCPARPARARGVLTKLP
jgi:hypothetical protein